MMESQEVAVEFLAVEKWLDMIDFAERTYLEVGIPCKIHLQKAEDEQVSFFIVPI